MTSAKAARKKICRCFFFCSTRRHADDRKSASTPAEAAAEAAPAKSGGGIKGWLPLILSVVLMPALAFGMTKFVIVPQLQTSLGIKPAADAAAGGKSKSGTDVKKISVPFNKLLVNIGGSVKTMRRIWPPRSRSPTR